MKTFRQFSEGLQRRDAPPKPEPDWAMSPGGHNLHRAGVGRKMALAGAFVAAAAVAGHAGKHGDLGKAVADSRLSMKLNHPGGLVGHTIDGWKKLGKKVGDSYKKYQQEKDPR